MILLRSATRILALIGKELVEIIRRPATVVSLILGPFLILAIFGLGYQGVRSPVRAVIVVPPTAGLPTDPATYQEAAPGVQVEAVVADRAPAEAQLRAHAIDAVIVYPADLRARFDAGQRSTIIVEIDEVDPARVQFTRVLADQLAERTNRTIVSRAVATAQGATGGGRVPADVVAAPTQADVGNLAPVEADLVTFFAPAALVLILQHLCVTLVALSLLRERTSGILELYRVGPTSAWEIVTAKVAAFLVIGSTVAAVSLALLVLLLHVPLLGPLSAVGGIVLLVLLASIGIGLLIAVLSDSERMAVQASLLTLLASIFFSGFVIDLELFRTPVRVLGALLPVTHGIDLLRDAMLFGTTGDTGPAIALAAIAVVTIGTAWMLLRRSMAARA